jgi:hypothetical protein
VRCRTQMPCNICLDARLRWRKGLAADLFNFVDWGKIRHRPASVLGKAGSGSGCREEHCVLT